MQIQLPPIPPVHVTFATTEPLFYTQWDFWLSVGTLLLAGITGWLALETRKMRQGSDKAIGELSKHAGLAATASRESSEAARASAVLTESALKLGERAYVTIESTEVLRRNQSSFPEYAATSLQNGGRTPALNMRSFQQWSVWAELPEELDYAGFGGANASAGSLGPGSSAQMPLAFELPNDQYALAVRNEARLYVWGMTRYDDVFGIEHETKWCLKYVLETQQFIFAPRHNGVT